MYVCIVSILFFEKLKNKKKYIMYQTIYPVDSNSISNSDTSTNPDRGQKGLDLRDPDTNTNTTTTFKRNDQLKIVWGLVIAVLLVLIFLIYIMRTVDTELDDDGTVLFIENNSSTVIDILVDSSSSMYFIDKNSNIRFLPHVNDYIHFKFNSSRFIVSGWRVYENFL